MAIEDEATVEELTKLYKEKRRLFELFSQQVSNEFLTQPSLNTGIPSVIHSVRSRLKGEDNFAEKIRRKRADGRLITKENLFFEITDCAGLRILHLHQSQFSEIHKFIRNKVKSKSWKLLEKPTAYTWDPESVDYFKSHSLQTSVKPSYYTSVHYLIAPANDQEGMCCEVQVRTLFEEIWGEIDHSINYPKATDKMASVEQLRVLSKLVSTGSRLADAIFKVHSEKRLDN
jgi:putative GTP pyrophosphokinase